MKVTLTRRILRVAVKKETFSYKFLKSRLKFTGDNRSFNNSVGGTVRGLTSKGVLSCVERGVYTLAMPAAQIVKAYSL